MRKLMSVRWNAREGRGILLGGILVAALVGFEIFNFDTTKFALQSLFGSRRFVGMEWAAILAFSFCGIDFAGLIRLFTPEQGVNEPKEVWLLTGAWLLGATMNAVMTWYAVSVAIAGRELGTVVVTSADVLLYAPVFVAVLVWLTRILFIGSISVAGDRMLHSGRAAAMPRRAPIRANGQSGYPRRQGVTIDDDVLGGEL
ncbi:MAG: hypothetical protein KC419_05525 [Anaerolineales bacterium]|nr:hypothetical protein [Anaerolineales bacterium]